MKQTRQLQCASTDEQMRMWSIRIGEHHSGTEKKEMRQFTATRTALRMTTLREEREKEKHHVTSLTCGILKNDTNEFLYRTKTDSKTLNTKVRLPKRERVGKG